MYRSGAREEGVSMEDIDNSMECSPVEVVNAVHQVEEEWKEVFHILAKRLSGV